MRRCVAVVVLVTAVVLVGAGPAAAQQDPYSGGTFNPGGACHGTQPSVTVDKTSGLFVGDPLVATGAGFPPGAVVTLLFDGRSFATATADASGGFRVTGTVPDVPKGEYMVSASAPGCATAFVDPGVDVLGHRTQVLGLQLSNGGGGGGTGGALARTGIDVLLLTLLGVGLVLVGMWLRRRRHPRRPA